MKISTLKASSSLSGNITLNPSPNFVGIVTVANPSAFTGNLTLDAGSKTQVVGNLTLSDSKGFIGLTTVVIGSGGAGDGAIQDGVDSTIKASVTSVADGRYLHVGIKSNSTILLGGAIPTGANYIGLATVVIGAGGAGFQTVFQGAAPWSNTVTGNVTLDAGSKTQIAGNLTLSDSKNYIGLTTTTIGNNPVLGAGANYFGLATIDIGTNNNIAIKGNLTLSDSKGFVGLTTAIVGSALPAGANFIGLATVVIGAGGAGFQTVFQGGAPWSTTVSGNVTLDAGSQTKIVGNLTLSDAKTYIGLTTATIGTALPAGANFIGLVSIAQPLSTTFSGNVTLDAGSKTQITGNLTLADAKTYVGLVTATVGNNPVLGTGANFIGLATVTIGAGGAGDGAILDGVDSTIKASVTSIADGRYLHVGIKSNSTVLLGAPLPTGANYIGLVTVANTVPVSFSGNVTLDAGSKTQIAGNVTLSDAKTYIGLTTATIGNNPTLGAGASYIGLATVDIGTNNNIAVKGNLTLSDSRGFIGLTTSVIGSALPVGANFIGLATVTIGAGGAGDGAILDGADSTIKASVTSIADGRYLHVGIKSNSTVLIGNTPNVAVVGNVTLSDAKTYVGLVTATLGAGSAFVGIVTVANPSAFTGNLTLDAGSKTQIVGNLTLSDARTYIGLTTATIGNNPILGTGANYIGLATVTIGAGGAGDGAILDGVDSAIKASVTSIADGRYLHVGIKSNSTIIVGNTPNVAVVGNVTLSDAKTYIGLTTTTLGVGSATIGLVRSVQETSPWAVSFSGNVTLDAGSKTAITGNLTLSDAKTYIGLVTATPATAWPNPNTFIGLVTATIGAGGAGDGAILDGVDSTIKASVTSIADGRYLHVGIKSNSTVLIGNTPNVAIVGNLTLSNANGFIGLVSIAQPISTTFSGNVTLDAGSKTQITGNLTLSDAKTYIGLVTTTQANAIPAGANYIGLVTVDIGSQKAITFSGNVTLDAGSKTQVTGNLTIDSGNISLKGNVTLSGPLPTGANYIGLITVDIGSQKAVTFSGNVTLDDGSLTGIVGNLTLSDSKNYIGLTTTTLGVGNTTIGIVRQGTDPWNVAFSGNVTLDAGSFTGIKGNLTLANANGFIGLVSVSGFANPLPVTSSGNVTLDDGSLTGIVGNLTLSDAKTYIGLTTATLGAGASYIGLATIDIGTNKTVAVTGNLTLSDAKTYIGLVTATNVFLNNSTVFTQIVSATGNTTIFTPPASQRFFIQNLHLASLGRAEVEIRSGATTLIPFTGLATTGGYIHNFNNEGLPSRSVNDAFVVNLNGAATISLLANVRFL